MRLVLTGAAGFVGSHFAESALVRADELGYSEIIIIDALTYSGRRENLAAVLDDPRVRFMHGSINDPVIVDEALRDADAIIHLAAESHVDRSISSPKTFFETNVLGTHQLLESALANGVRRFLHVSSDEVYGSISLGSWDEDHVLAPNSPYSASKAASDLAALSYFSTYGLGVVVTRAANNYGARQYPEKLIPLFVTNLLDGLKVPLYGDGKNVREWLHVSDHVAGIWRAFEAGVDGEIYNFGAEVEMNNLDITRRILSILNLDESMIQPVEDRLGHDRRYSLNWTKAQRDLGWSPKVEFESALVETVHWYRDNREWWEPLKGLA